MNEQPMPPVEILHGDDYKATALNSAGVPAETSTLTAAAAGVLWVLALVMLACAPAVVAFVWRWAL